MTNALNYALLFGVLSCSYFALLNYTPASTSSCRPSTEDFLASPRSVSGRRGRPRFAIVHVSGAYADLAGWEHAPRKLKKHTRRTGGPPRAFVHSKLTAIVRAAEGRQMRANLPA
ncbi:hypothetical protein HYPSUDRAFT_202081 [Hypholoma sublateritium FD-334 SS-4]|uniref:Uncharacterized protein n=1 Tax=Hypholoma sublateritium (strain FD-334 SS-4) TaxID=945553 RepID=A0A0D2PRN9_HYPSF|nr:hypothetical protein HYPSUDRAFT_202081 [Hypholoma sublateritium FD-334 SS-4]